MPARSPLHFDVTVTRRATGDAAVESAPRVAIEGGPPPEFGGDASRWSPEHLLLAAAALCYVTTLEWWAAHREVAILALRCRADGVVEKTSRGLAFTAVHLSISVTARPGEAAAVHGLVDLAKQSCLVSNSLACPVAIAAEVDVPPQPGRHDNERRV
jgi:organic hydroperoxide reductase OsmC/OhrA